MVAEVPRQTTKEVKEPRRPLLDRLSGEQKEFVMAVRNGDSVLLLGEAGTGKSACLAALDPTVQVTATTGVASSCISGATTLHNFLGIRPLRPGIPESFSLYWKMLSQNKSALLRIRELATLVVDEVSMLHGRFLLIVDLLFRKAREVHDLPFGGMQMILVGDFLQIPPVCARDDPWKQMFAFEVFDLMGFYPRRFDLTKVFRQSDAEFLRAMQQARNGSMSPASLAFLRCCESTQFPDDGVKPTIVFQYNRDVDAENDRCMAEVPDAGDTRRLLFRTHCIFALARYNPALRASIYTATRRPTLGAQAQQRMLEQIEGMQPDMHVRTGMQVLFRFNVSAEGAHVANGTCGLVVGWVLVRPEFGTTTLVRLDANDLKAPNMLRDPHGFPNGKLEVVVPVVRVTRTGDYYAVHPHTMPIQWDPTERARKQREQQQQNGNECANGPIAAAEAAAADGLDLGSYLMLLVRRLPFVAGWAMTAHRVQGMTLDRAELRIELGAGKLPFPACYYVVCSRVRSPAGLKITGRLEAKHFWTSWIVVQHFGATAARQAFGKLWQGPTLQANHVAHEKYTAWLGEVKTSGPAVSSINLNGKLVTATKRQRKK